MKKVKNFLRSERGNVALMVGLTLPVLVLAIGGGADYANILQRKSKLQAAVDSATLAAYVHYQQHPQISTGQLKSYFDTHLKAAMSARLKSVLSIASEKLVLDRKNGKLDAFVKAYTPTSFIRLAGFPTLELNVQAQTKASMSYTEVALVLDTTGSMRYAGKIQELKRAAKSFLDTIYAKISGPPETFKVAVVPFSQYVNVGKKYRNAPWISVPADQKFAKQHYWKQCKVWRCQYYTYKSGRVCWYTGFSTSGEDGGGGGGGGHKVCTWRSWRSCGRWVWSPLRPCREYRWTTYREVKWDGCVGSRNYPLNLRDGSYGFAKVPGVMDRPRNTYYPENSENGWRWSDRNRCPSPLLPLKPLKTERSRIVSAINSLHPRGNTYIPIGLMWGWRVLSPNAPFTEGADYQKVRDKDVRKIIVLMTDGMNTRAPDRRAGRAYHDHQQPDTAYANRMLTEACKSITAPNPATGKRYADIITVTFNVTDPQIKHLLKSCSTLGSYDAKSGELVKVFNKIARELAELHLSR